MTNVPHFAYPFRFGVGGHAATVDQDELDDIRNCVMILLRTEVGSRLDLPEYGVPQQFLKENGINVNGVLSAINRWEPRAQVAMSVSEIKDLIQYATVTVAGSTDA